ncbi:MAG TPA: hypothetical protein VNT26_17810, partial [Candidatus Sulfotelmatobacter sp.]|nr:hypothetical protein [Candidatus Sulfotelmatobacter sp.]
MTLTSALIFGPFFAGLGLLLCKPNWLRIPVVALATLAACCGTIALACLPLPGAIPALELSAHWSKVATLVVELGMGLYVVWVGLRAKRPLIVALMVVQAGLMVWLEATAGAHLEAANNLFVDKLAVIMALINGIVGGGICLYALGYMREYHEEAHKEVADRRPFFFALLFVFMGAMFGIIFANSLLWLFLFWEITTLCSFLLIGYSQTEEAR